MVDVDDVYALHAAKSLVAVGWVHTLPAAGTAADALGGVPPPVVLSGEQAHTQAAFQVALPEAVAVLVSPGRPAAAGGAGAPPGGGGNPGRPAPRATAVRLGGEAAVAAVRACTERYVKREEGEGCGRVSFFFVVVSFCLLGAAPCWRGGWRGRAVRNSPPSAACDACGAPLWVGRRVVLRGGTTPPATRRTDG